MFYDADLPIFISDFATPVRAASGVVFDAVFDREGQVVALDDSGSHIRTTPRIRCTEADANLIGKGETLYIENQPWRVAAKEYDGVGHVLIQLHKINP